MDTCCLFLLIISGHRMMSLEAKSASTKVILLWQLKTAQNAATGLSLTFFTPFWDSLKTRGGGVPPFISIECCSFYPSLGVFDLLYFVQHSFKTLSPGVPKSSQFPLSLGVPCESLSGYACGRLSKCTSISNVSSLSLLS